MKKLLIIAAAISMAFLSGCCLFSGDCDNCRDCTVKAAK